MPWSKVDDRFYDHPKTVAVGTMGAGLFVLALSYTANKLTDGFIPTAMIRRLVADVDDPVALADSLVEAGLFERVDGGYLIHDYLDYNPPAAKVIAEREAAKERMRAAREAHAEECSGELPANFDRTSGAVQPVPYPVSRIPIPMTDNPTTSGADAPTPPPKPPPKPKREQPETTPLERHFLSLWNAKYLNSSQRELLAKYETEYGYERVVEVSKWCHTENMALGHAINAMRSALKNWDKPKPKAGSNGNHQRRVEPGTAPGPDFEETNELRRVNGVPPLTLAQFEKIK
jgi:hypothetical protein